MKNLKNITGVQELNQKETTSTNGGYVYSGTSNPLVYAAEAVVNGIELIADGVEAIYDWLTE